MLFRFIFHVISVPGDFKMADGPALFDDEKQAETKPEEDSPIFGETTEISLDPDDKNEGEAAEKDAGEQDGRNEKADPEPGAAASVDVTNLSESKEVDSPKQKAEVKYLSHLLKIMSTFCRLEEYNFVDYDRFWSRFVGSTHIYFTNSNDYVLWKYKFSDVVSCFVLSMT